MNQKYRWYCLPLLAAVGLAAAGCSGATDDLPREAVSGTVTLDGQPLPDGTIQFTPSSRDGAVTSGAASIKDGKFSLARAEGLVPGTYGIAIYSAPKEASQSRPKSPGNIDRKTLPKETIPARYNSASKVTQEIKKGGPNYLEFALDTK